MKTLKFIDADSNTHFIHPIRPSFDGTQKDFSNLDTPKGKEAVVFQAIKNLRQNGVNLGFEMPQYSNEQIQTLGEKTLKEGNICPTISPAILAKFTFLEMV